MIDNYSFGKIVISGTTYTSDIKIKKGEVVTEWWRRTGHIVGIDDIGDLLEIKPNFLILGTGSPGFMKADTQLRSQLQQHKIELIEEPTEKAVEIFNELMAQKKNVAAGFHLTC